MDRKIMNIITMIGCDKEEFENISNKAIGEITFSSGSYYADYVLFDDIGLLAKYNSKGQLIFKR